MRLRNARLRTKVTALLVSLIALWAFTAWVTVREGLNMLGVATLNSSVSDPSVQLVAELQAERRLTLGGLGDPDTARRQREALTAQRKRTEAAVANLRELVGSNSVRLMASAELDQRLGEVFRKLDGLDPARKVIDGGRADRIRAAAVFTEIIDSIDSIYDALATLDDEAIAKDTRTLIELNRAQELFAQGDALATGALNSGRFTDDERVLFTQIVGIQRFVSAQAGAELPPEDRAAYERLVSSEPFTRLRTMENLIMQGSQSEVSGTVNVRQWSATAQPALSQLKEMVLAAGAKVVDRSTPIAVGVIVRLTLAGGLGLFAVIASIVLSITTARALVLQLEKLRIAAWELANERLPSVVERIGRGEEVDVKSEVPPLEFGDDQIGHVGQAFNAVQQTALKVAAEQAQLRRDIADILRNLARRTQSLVHRQLSVLDVMERRENDPQELRDLFRLDHLATRMRRYAENLLVLSGAAPGRSWRDAVPMIDVVRGALAEIEDYTRVDVLPLGQVALEGRAVSDVIHLVAELVENAASFSPPYTTVQVSGHVVAHGYALEIEDRGLGMSPSDIAGANERIANPPELKLSGNARLGLYVVSRLAERHEVRVAFKTSPYGGTTVVVLIPQDLISEQEMKREAPAGVPQARMAGTGVMNGTTPVVAAVRSRGADPLGITNGHAPVGRRGKGVDEPVRAVSPDLREPDQPVVSRHAFLDDHGGLGGSADLGGPASSTLPVLPPPDTSHTPGGLPRRVPQTHLAAPLQDDEPAPALPPDGDADDRSPEMIRAAMASFQDGTRRGRSDAGQLLDQGGDPGTDGESVA